MSEFFLELFSEEIPSSLQINARNDLIQISKKFFYDNEIVIKDKINIYSNPNSTTTTNHRKTQKQTI